MEATVTIAQIGLYNPQRMTAQQIEALFIVREKQFGILMQSLREESNNSIPQHHLIMAQRGMGKTTMLKRIEVELRKEEFKNKYIPLLFPEEQYNVKDIAEFWLNCIDVLADMMDIEKNTSLAAQIDNEIQELIKIKDTATLSTRAYDYLMHTTASLGRRPVLLIDNMNLLFDRLSEEEQHLLRSLLTKNNAPIIIGGSTTYIEGTTNYGAPFYDAFQMHYLEKLTIDESFRILENLAVITNEKAVIPSIYEKKARLKALHQLTGGNPRTTVMLFRLIVKGFSKDINEDLESLLDEVTPIYKARFEELSEQMQIIVDAIALHWDPITLEKLREVTRYENGQLSPQLKRLMDMGWIEKPKGSPAKGGAYEMSERFFNIWFLMRRSSRRHKKGVYCLSHFLEVYYGDDVDTMAHTYLSAEFTSLSHINSGLALAKISKDENIRKRLFEKSQDVLFSLLNEKPDLLDQFEMADIFEKGTIQELFQKSEEEFEKGNYIVAEKLLDEAEKTTSNKEQKAALNAQKGLNFYRLYAKDHFPEYFEKAETALLKAIELNEESEYYYILSVLYVEATKFSEAEKCNKEAIHLESDNAMYYFNLAKLYVNQKRFEEAEKIYHRAIELSPKSEYYFNLAKLYVTQKRLEEAEKIYHKAIELNPEEPEYYFNLAKLYDDDLDKFEEAEKMYHKAIHLNPEDAYYYSFLAILHIRQNKFEEAEQMCKKAIELDKKNNLHYALLGELYQIYLNKNDEAEKAYKKAIELDPNKTEVCSNLGVLYSTKNDFKRVEESFKKTIEISRYNLIGLYLLQNRLANARQEFNNIVFNEESAISYYILKVIFDLTEHNEGIASENFSRFSSLMSDDLHEEALPDLYCLAGIAIKLGHGKWLVNTLEQHNYDTDLTPYYVAVNALMSPKPQQYLNTKAVEIRESALNQMEQIKKYM